jgi:hypothetical protein
MQSIDELIQQQMDKRVSILKATQKAGVGGVTDRDIEAIRKMAPPTFKPKAKIKPKPKPGGKTSSYQRGSMRLDTYQSGD